MKKKKTWIQRYGTTRKRIQAQKSKGPDPGPQPCCKTSLHVENDIGDLPTDWLCIDNDDLGDELQRTRVEGDFQLFH